MFHGHTHECDHFCPQGYVETDIYRMIMQLLPKSCRRNASSKDTLQCVCVRVRVHECVCACVRACILGRARGKMQPYLRSPPCLHTYNTPPPFVTEYSWHLIGVFPNQRLESWISISGTLVRTSHTKCTSMPCFTGFLKG